jgi:hypothetical protein
VKTIRDWLFIAFIVLEIGLLWTYRTAIRPAQEQVYQTLWRLAPKPTDAVIPHRFE